MSVPQPPFAMKLPAFRGDSGAPHRCADEKSVCYDQRLPF
jgi:hypothetical protein